MWSKIVSRERVGLAGAVVILLLAVGCDLGVPATVYETAGSDVAAGDVDGDGDVDLVSVGNPDISVLLNDGTGKFSVTEIDDGDDQSYRNAVELADLDGDGDLDLVTDGITHTPESAESVLVRLGDGNGGFGPDIAQPESAELTGVHDIATGDLDDDGHVDVVVSTNAAEADHDPGLIVYTGDGTGQLELAQEVVVPIIDALAILDADGDGDQDVVGAGAQHQGFATFFARLAVFPGDGSGTLAAPVEHFLGTSDSWAYGVGSGDLNGDGHVDLVTAVRDIEQRDYAVFLGRADGTFADPTFVPTHMATLGDVITADIDVDGHVDAVAVGERTAMVSYGDGTGGFPADHGLVPNGHWYDKVLTADVDADGRPDLVFAEQLCQDSPNCESRVSVMPNIDGGRPD